MDGDLLGLSPSIVPDTTFTPSFQNNFWGVKHNGYEVLHNSLKKYLTIIVTCLITDFDKCTGVDQRDL